ncbi:MAG TPA: hypothetical protein ENH82_15465 [bacterium]|nr:hypothetical protein [bacterium]
MNEGFFTAKQTQSKSRPDGKTYSCASCGLYKDARSPKMKPYGEFKKKILIIGEAPGKTEDQRGHPWQGKMGRLLQNTFRRKLGMDLFEDCLCMNAVNCRPENNRTPTNYEVDCCRRSVLKVIEERKPKVIILLGNSALYCLLGHRWKKDLGGIMKWRGWTIPDQDFNCWICPTFHPSFVGREEKEVETVWLQDLERAIKKVDTYLLSKYDKPLIKIIEALDLSEILPSIPENYNRVAFDYETTGIKPHAKGHRIICVSIATSENKCYVFMMPKSRIERQPFIDLLANPDIGKMAHNMKFEEAWSVVRLRQPVQNWVWDSMQAAHVLDNRPGVTGLKFQVYVRFGVVDYSSEVEPYLKSASKDGNAINHIYELLEKPGGKEMLLKYCGWDAIWTYRLSMLQMNEMNYEDDLPF